jgi:chaperonin cofactor prefoldin
MKKVIVLRNLEQKLDILELRIKKLEDLYVLATRQMQIFASATKTLEEMLRARMHGPLSGQN